MRLAQNEDRTGTTDATLSVTVGLATLPPGEHIDELGDFLE
jgi:hypothetical protein